MKPIYTFLFSKSGNIKCFWLQIAQLFEPVLSYNVHDFKLTIYEPKTTNTCIRKLINNIKKTLKGYFQALVVERLDTN